MRAALPKSGDIWVRSKPELPKTVMMEQKTREGDVLPADPVKRFYTFLTKEA